MRPVSKTDQQGHASGVPGTLKCQHCGSPSLIRSHGTVACLPCGWVLEEPRHEAWDVVSATRGAADNLGPRWTEAERLLWKGEAPAG